MYIVSVYPPIRALFRLNSCQYASKRRRLAKSGNGAMIWMGP